MPEPTNYAELMEEATAIRERLEYAIRYDLRMTVTRDIAELNNLVEHAYLVGHVEGIQEGKVEGIQEGKEESNCHLTKDEEWERTF